MPELEPKLTEPVLKPSEPVLMPKALAKTAPAPTKVVKAEVETAVVEPSSAPKAAPKTGRGTLLAAVAAVAIATAAAAFFFAGSNGDNVANMDAQHRLDAFNHAIAAGGIVAPTVLSQTDAQAAVTALQPGLPDLQSAATLDPSAPVGFVDPSVAPQIQKALTEHRMKMASFAVWDDCSEDGDQVVVSGPGFSYVVPIWNAPTWLSVPVPTDGSGSMVTITGLVDGGGGITLAVGTQQQPVPIPPLLPGQLVQLPVR